MIEPHKLLAFWLAGIALNLVPGSDTLYVLGRSISQGRAAGFVAALGIGVGCLVHITAAALGVSALLANSAQAFAAVKLAGAAYLAWQGVTMLRDRSPLEATDEASKGALWTLFRKGVVTNALNPKVALFFLAFLPQFIDPGGAAPAAQTMTLGFVFDVTGTLYLLLLASFAGTVGNWLRRNSRAVFWQRRVTGVLFLGLAGKLAFADSRS